jgi:hypothetical protein
MWRLVGCVKGERVERGKALEIGVRRWVWRVFRRGLRK